jgi:glutamate carboxypeptidase
MCASKRLSADAVQAGALPLAEHVQRLYAEVGGSAKIKRVTIGAGTDAAFAALETKAPVIEGMDLRSFGAHTNDAEYVNISSIEPFSIC